MKETVAFMLDPVQVATVRQFAKDQGYPSTSSALRRIIDEWLSMKAERLGLAREACCVEEARATAGELVDL